LIERSPHHDLKVCVRLYEFEVAETKKGSYSMKCIEIKILIVNSQRGRDMNLLLHALNIN
jgi:hypothetical protein